MHECRGALGLELFILGARQLCFKNIPNNVFQLFFEFVGLGRLRFVMQNPFLRLQQLEDNGTYCLLHNFSKTWELLGVPAQPTKSLKTLCFP